MDRDWPSLADIRATQTLLAPHLVRTPTVPWDSATLARLLGDETKLFLKLELLQATGTFKARGALTWALSLTPEQRARGIAAVSAGNRAIAAACRQGGGSAGQDAVLKTANRAALAMARGSARHPDRGNGRKAAIVDRLVKEEYLTFVHCSTDPTWRGAPGHAGRGDRRRSGSRCGGGRGRRRRTGIRHGARDQAAAAESRSMA
jgi:threonine dehydratase